jgi:hypothetical protein
LSRVFFIELDNLKKKLCHCPFPSANNFALPTFAWPVSIGATSQILAPFVDFAFPTQQRSFCSEEQNVQIAGVCGIVLSNN